jgi:MYXO-CTERM domain-containing protein
MKRISLGLALLMVSALPAAAQTTFPRLELPTATAWRPSTVEAATRRMVQDPSWLLTDAAFTNASDVSVKARRVGKRFVARVTPIVAGVAVEGADRVVVVGDDGVRQVEGTGQSLTPMGSFRLPSHEAMLAAFSSVSGGIVGDVTVERVDGFARQVWLASPAGLRPAWRVRVPTWQLADLRDVWVDAVDGSIIKSQPVASLGTLPVPTAAKVFEFAPAAGGLNVADLVDVDLVGLRPAAVGAALRGDHFETANCCKFVVCNDASADCLQRLGPGEVASDVASCATQEDIDGDLAVESVIQPANGIPRDTLPIPAQFVNVVPDPLFVKVVFCAEIPRARSVAADGATPAGWFFTPVDGDRANAVKCGAPGADPIGCAAEEDEFAEVQVYHGTQVFFDHIRTVLEDPAFCLGGLSQQCDADTGAPVLGDDGEPVLPFHIATNVLFPKLDFNALVAQVAPPPLGAGLGATAGNPVVIDDFQRLPNAAFVPALEGGPVQIPPELQAIAALFNRPFDSNVYFQGTRDFAYDGDVTRHEFTHAIVHSFVPGLGSLGKDSFGSNAESGGLNEGWADYFSSSFSNSPTVGDYAGQGLGGLETGLRNNDNDKRCPNDTIGQVHADSEPWAGALWTIREQHRTAGGDVIALDRALLGALAIAANDEDLSKAADHAEAAIRVDISPVLADFAHEEFVSRGVLDCFRVVPLATVNAAGDGITVTRKDLLFQPGVADVGLSNLAPSVLQFRIDVPAASAGFTLRWQQAAGGGGLGGGGAPAPMAVAVSEVAIDDATARIEWRYEGQNNTLAVPYDGAGVGLDFNEDESVVSLGAADGQGVQAATFTHTLTSDGCTARSFVVSIVSLEGGAQLQNIDVDNIATDTACAAEGEGEGEGDGPTVEGCPCSGGTAPPTSLALLGLGLVVLRRRRR